jgi:hypothetical protein
MDNGAGKRATRNQPSNPCEGSTVHACDLRALRSPTGELTHRVWNAQHAASKLAG